MFKHTLAAATLAAALAAPAFAQQPPTAKPENVDQRSMPSQNTGSRGGFVQTQ